MNITSALSAAVLRFVRCEKSLSAAIAQHKEAERRVARWTEHAKKGDEYSAKMLASHLESALAWFQRVAELFEAEHPEELAAPVAPVAVEAAPIVAATKAESQPVSDSLRVKAMRAFYAVAKRAGLNLKDALGMTWALAKYLRCVVSSRANLSAGQWAESTAAVSLGLLAW